MLHAFNAGTFDTSVTPPAYNAGTGEELFAYVPNNLLQSLKNMKVTTTSTHQYMVDSSPKAADVWLDTNGDNIKQTSEWKTVLIAGERKGGRGLFALDVTSPQSLGTSNYPKVMWEIDNAAVANLGQTWSEPNIGLVQISEGGVTKDRWVAFVGGGYWYSTTLKSVCGPKPRCITIVDNTGFAPSGRARSRSERRRALHTPPPRPRPSRASPPAAPAGFRAPILQGRSSRIPPSDAAST